MLVIGFRVGEERYAVRGADVVEVIPRVALRPVALAPPAIAGLFTYRGHATPVVDLCRLLTDHPCPDRLSSRILILALTRDGRSRRVGLLAEGVTEVTSEGAAPQPALALPDAPYLGSVLVREHGMVQLVEPERLLPDDLWRVLFPPGDLGDGVG